MNPLIEQLVVKLRNPATGRPEFRAALESIGEQMGYVVANELPKVGQAVQTQMGESAFHYVLTEDPVIVGILRAGIPFMNGLLRAFPESESGFIGAMRDEKTAKAEISYAALPSIKGRRVILTDTIIATGGSIIESIKLLEQYGPKEIIVAGAIACTPGIENIHRFRENKKIYVAAIDPKLNEKFYIVPGLGDAGDRSYGRKE